MNRLSQCRARFLVFGLLIGMAVSVGDASVEPAQAIHIFQNSCTLEGQSYSPGDEVCDPGGTLLKCVEEVQPVGRFWHWVEIGSC